MAAKMKEKGVDQIWIDLKSIQEGINRLIVLRYTMFTKNDVYVIFRNRN